MTTTLLFHALVVLVALQRLAELRVSRHNEAKLVARGGRVHGDPPLAWTHALLGAWLIAMPVEVWLLGRQPVAPVAIAALALFGLGQAMRGLARRALGKRWTAGVVTVPGEKVVRGGIFARVRHPSYLGFVIEIFALPLVHGAFVTSALFTMSTIALMRARIRAEERALRRDTDYRIAFDGSGVFSIVDGVR